MKPILAVLIVVAALFLLASAVLAQSGSGYQLSWWSVDGGAQKLTADPYTLVGTAGQPDANALTGGGFTLAGGFWPAGALAAGHEVYLPLVIRCQ